MSAIRWAVFAAVLALTLEPVTGQPVLSTIQDTLYKADGSRFEGYAYIEWKSFEAADGSLIPQQSIVVPVRSGNLRVQLVPTNNISSGAFYQVKFNSGGRVQFTEYWTVPVSSVALKLNEVRIPLPPVQIPNESGNTSISIAMVVGLQEALNQRPLKDGGFTSNRVVSTSSSGQLTSVTGNASDCVRVDGSSGPCSGGSVGSSPHFIDAEIPSGTINGTNAEFELSELPSPANSLMLFRNGLLQRVNSDFTLSGTTITFLSGAIPQSDDILLASYRN